MDQEMDWKKGDLCEGCQEKGKKYCINCDTIQCDKCMIIIHSFSKNKNHQIIEIPLIEQEKIELNSEKKEEMIPCEICQIKNSEYECIDCDLLLCERDKHIQHHLIPLLISKYCEKHKERYKKYCNTCHKLVCILCISGDHFGHELKLFNKIINDLEKDISKKYKEMCDKTLENTIQLELFEKELKINQKNHFYLIQNIKRELQKLHDLIYEKEKELCLEDENIKLIKQEYNKLLNWNQQSKKEISISEKLMKKEMTSPFQYSMEGFSNLKNIELLLNQNYTIHLKNNIQKILDLENIIDLIKNLKLMIPIDPSLSFITNTKVIGSIEEGVVFHLNVLSPKNKLVSNEILNLYKFNIDIISCPKDEFGYDIIPNIEQIIQDHKIQFHLISSKSGEFTLRIHMNEIEVKGSPLVVKIEAKKIHVIKRGDNIYSQEWSWSHGIEWDCLSFQVNKNIYFYGIGVFTGIGKHLVKMELLNKDNMKFFTKEFQFITRKQEIKKLELKNPIILESKILYTIKLFIEGDNTFYHIENGRDFIEQDGIEFQFYKSSLDENGTDPNMGQIPEIYYLEF